MLTQRQRAVAAVSEVDRDLDDTLDAMLAVVGFDRVLVAMARAAERMRLAAKGRNSHVEQSFDMVQGRLELAAEDLKGLREAALMTYEVATARVSAD